MWILPVASSSLILLEKGWIEMGLKVLETATAYRILACLGLCSLPFAAWKSAMRCAYRSNLKCNRQVEKC